VRDLLDVWAGVPPVELRDALRAERALSDKRLSDLQDAISRYDEDEKRLAAERALSDALAQALRNLTRVNWSMGQHRLKTGDIAVSLEVKVAYLEGGRSALARYDDAALAAFDASRGTK
jgi:hypothetical protein